MFDFVVFPNLDVNPNLNDTDYAAMVNNLFK